MILGLTLRKVLQRFIKMSTFSEKKIKSSLSTTSLLTLTNVSSVKIREIVSFYCQHFPRTPGVGRTNPVNNMNFPLMDSNVCRAYISELFTQIYPVTMPRYIAAVNNR